MGQRYWVFWFLQRSWKSVFFFSFSFWNCPIFKYGQTIWMCLKYFLSQTKHICQPPVCNLCPMPTFNNSLDMRPREVKGCAHGHSEPTWQFWEGLEFKLTKPSPGLLLLYQTVIWELHRSVSLLGWKQVEDKHCNQKWPLLYFFNSNSSWLALLLIVKLRQTRWG